MFCALTYLFGHSIYFARLHHVNLLCKHKYAFLQMKEAPNQKVQEKKPLLKFKNTKKNMCLERIWRKKCFRACRHRPLLLGDSAVSAVLKESLAGRQSFTTSLSPVWFPWWHGRSMVIIRTPQKLRPHCPHFNLKRLNSLSS